MALRDYRTAVVTGASAGIGAAVVRALRQRNIEVYATARRADRLDSLAKETGCKPLALDVTDTDAVYRALEPLEVDILVNNAGLGRVVDVHKARASDIDMTIDTNVSGALHTVSAVTRGMAARKRGHVVNIGSVAGLYPIRSAIYGASKAAIHLMNQNLRLELAGTGVRVTEICPGRTTTEFADVAFDDPEEGKAFMSGFRLLDPEDIADAVLYALDTPWHVNISMIEVTPTEQAPGGIRVVTVERD